MPIKNGFSSVILLVIGLVILSGGYLFWQFKYSTPAKRATTEKADSRTIQLKSDNPASPIQTQSQPKFQESIQSPEPELPEASTIDISFPSPESGWTESSADKAPEGLDGLTIRNSDGNYKDFNFKGRYWTAQKVLTKLEVKAPITYAADLTNGKLADQGWGSGTLYLRGNKIDPPSINGPCFEAYGSFGYKGNSARLVSLSARTTPCYSPQEIPPLDARYEAVYYLFISDVADLNDLLSDNK